MPDFWRNSGFHLLARDGVGRLGVTDDFLRAYLMRPEVRPPEGEACAAERDLHAALLENPRIDVPAERLARLDDPDARDNYRVLLDFFRRLVAAGTVEGCYVGLFRQGPVALPSMFVDQMAHAIARAVLDGSDDPIRVRAAELLFREQQATLQDGAVLLGDAETVAMYATSRGMGNLGRLIVEGGAPVRSVELDVLRPETAETYWARDEKFDTVLDLTFTRPGLDALCRVLEGWVRRLLGVDVRVRPLERIADERWRWHLGLDVESSAILNDLYNGKEVEEERLKRLLALFRLEFADPSLMRADIAGAPVYMGLAMNAERKIRLKPQNLIVNLPLAGAA